MAVRRGAFMQVGWLGALAVLRLIRPAGGSAVKDAFESLKREVTPPFARLFDD